ncbi:unnamed protein product, partial [Prorocentrum cordatum]
AVLAKPLEKPATATCRTPRQGLSSSRHFSSSKTTRLPRMRTPRRSRAWAAPTRTPTWPSGPAGPAGSDPRTCGATGRSTWPRSRARRRPRRRPRPRRPAPRAPRASSPSAGRWPAGSAGCARGARRGAAAARRRRRSRPAGPPRRPPPAAARTAAPRPAGAPRPRPRAAGRPAQRPRRRGPPSAAAGAAEGLHAADAEGSAGHAGLRGLLRLHLSAPGPADAHGLRPRAGEPPEPRRGAAGPGALRRLRVVGGRGGGPCLRGHLEPVLPGPRRAGGALQEQPDHALGGPRHLQAGDVLWSGAGAVPGADAAPADAPAPAAGPAARRPAGRAGRARRGGGGQRQRGRPRPRASDRRGCFAARPPQRPAAEAGSNERPLPAHRTSHSSAWAKEQELPVLPQAVPTRPVQLQEETDTPVPTVVT